MSNGTEVAPARRETELAGSGAVRDRAGFRLAVFGALLVVVLFAGYGLGRLSGGTASASAPPTDAQAAGAQAAGAQAAGAQAAGAQAARAQAAEAQAAEMQAGEAQAGEAQAGEAQAGEAQAGEAATGGAMPGMALDENQPHSHNAGGTTNQGGPAMPMGAAVGGLSLSSGGLTLVPSATTFRAAERQRLEFRITGAGGAAVTTYAIVHDKPLHLVVVRRDLSGFQHLHPAMAPDGTWGIDLTLARPGIYRMVVDFTAVVGGRQVATTLGSDLTVAGDYVPVALAAPSRDATVDGFALTYEGTPNSQSTQPILIGATLDRRPAALEPYLGAYGHLVVLRQGDLAYVHVHPETQLADGKVKFWLALPSSGTYRMFFDFQVGGQVHTATWTTVLG